MTSVITFFLGFIQTLSVPIILAFSDSATLGSVETIYRFDGGVLADSIGKIFGTGSGRGTGFLIFITGVLICVTSVILSNVKSVKSLKTEVTYVFQNNPQ